MKILGIIPARFASTRFPGKPLVIIGGKTMVRRVYEQAMQAKGLSEVVVATDDKRIFNEVESFGGKVVMTKTTHQSGTDRCLEALENFNQTFDAVINIQGDEPFIKPEQIDQLAKLISKPSSEIATLMRKIETNDEVFNPNVVKVICDKNQKAIYFSRNPIPYLRNADGQWFDKFDFYKHIGMYAYRSSILKEITQLQLSSLEQAESLEQLRWIENGYTISIQKTEIDSCGIDTIEDLQKIANFL